ncbi:MAG: CopG family ribbon-helix-helix protein [Acidimicrobiales bacterium]
MKTAVSVPDELFEQVEGLAKREGKSRSQVYQEALAEYLLRRDPDTTTEAMDRVLEQVGAEPDQWVDAAARRIIEDVEW